MSDFTKNFSDSNRRRRALSWRNHRRNQYNNTNSYQENSQRKNSNRRNNYKTRHYSDYNYCSPQSINPFKYDKNSSNGQHEYNTASNNDPLASNQYNLCDSTINNNTKTESEPEKRVDEPKDLKVGPKQEINKKVDSAIEKTKLTSKESTSLDSSSSDSDSEPNKATEAVKNIVNDWLDQKNQKVPINNINVKVEVTKENIEESSSESSSEAETEEVKNDREKTFADDVICLGNIKQVENLIDDDDDDTHLNKCLFCEKNGHTSFNCFKICKNCGEMYHSLKECKKPINASIMLQNFMQFCMEQFCNYDPNKNFDFFKTTNDHSSNLNGQNSKSKYKCRHEKKKNKNHNSSSVKSVSKKRKFESSDSDSSSDSRFSISTKQRNKSEKALNKMYKLYTMQNPFITPFHTPVPLNFNAPQIGFNPMLAAFNQMMPSNQGLGYRTQMKK